VKPSAFTFMAGLFAIAAVTIIMVQDRRPALPLGPEGGPIDGIEHLTITPTGLGVLDERVGTGRLPQKGETCVVQYTGWFWQDGVRGASFDSSLEQSEPFSFVLGEGQVIKGWDEGVLGMQVGGSRRLTIPAALAYGDAGAGGVIPPGAALIFDVDLLAIE